MDYLVWVGKGEHDTDSLPVRGVRNPIEAVCVAVVVLEAENDVGTYHIIDVVPIFPMAKGKH